jgi:hypothetical protein
LQLLREHLEALDAAQIRLIENICWRIFVSLLGCLKVDNLCNSLIYQYFDSLVTYFEADYQAFSCSK